MKNGWLKSAAKWFALILLILTFFYQYLRTDKNISLILEYKSMSDFADSITFVNHSITFSNAILEGTIHNRGVLFFQTGLVALLVLLEVSLLGKSQKSERARN